MVQLHNILKSSLSKYDVVLDGKQRYAVESAMVDFAQAMVNRHQSAENKAIRIESVRLFPALIKGEWKLWLRKRSFIKAKKMAQIRANIENRPCHVVRSSEIAFVVQSTKEVRQLKKVGIYKKNVDAIKMNSAADFTAYPQKK